MITKTLSHFVLGLIVFIWVVPFVALVSTSLRSETEAKTAGFWTAFTPTELGHRFSTHDKGEKIKIFTMNGNIFDRLYYTSVIDFIDINYNNFHWFIFNVADIFITSGVII